MAKLYQIYGPDEDWLDLADLVKRLRVSKGTIRQAVREGRFPRPVKAGAQSAPRWSGLAIALWENTQSMLQATGEDDEVFPDDDEPPARKKQ